MNNISDEILIRHALLSSIEKEVLLIKKYEEYQLSNDRSDLKEMLKEFKKISEEHIEMIKNKLQKFSS